MSLIDNALVYFDEADISTSPASNVLKSPLVTDASRVSSSLNRIAKNPAGAYHINVVVNAAITGAEVVTLEDSADGSSWAAVTGGVITVGAAAAGSTFSIPMPLITRQYTRLAETVGTVGVISAFIAPQVSTDQ